MERSSAHGEARKCSKPPLADNDEPKEPVVGSFLFAEVEQQEPCHGPRGDELMDNKMADDSNRGLYSFQKSSFL